MQQNRALKGKMPSVLLYGWVSFILMMQSALTGMLHSFLFVKDLVASLKLFLAANYLILIAMLGDLY